MIKKNFIVILSFLLLICSSFIASAKVSIVDIIVGRVNEVVCILICLIWYVVMGITALLLLLAGIKYITSESPTERDEARRRIYQAVAGLIIVLVAMPLVNFLIQNTRIMQYEGCDCGLIPGGGGGGNVTTTTSTTVITTGGGGTTTPTITVPVTTPGVTTPGGGTSTTTTSTTVITTGGGGGTSTTIITTTTLPCVIICSSAGYPTGNCKSPSCDPSTEDEVSGGCNVGEICCCIKPTMTTSTTTTTTTSTTTTTVPCITNICQKPRDSCWKADDFGSCYPVGGRKGLDEACVTSGMPACCCANYGYCC